MFMRTAVAALAWIAVAALAWITVVVLASCYSPQLEECAVTCTTAEDCSPDQRCGADGWCVGEDRVGRCDVAPAADGGPLPGAPGELHIVITGQGEIELEALGEKCTSRAATGATCSYPIGPGVWVTLREKDGGGWRFAGWDWLGCTFGRPKSCLIKTASTGAATTVTARFDIDLPPPAP